METKEKQTQELEKINRTLAVVSLTIILSGRTILTQWSVNSPLIERFKELSKIMKGTKA